MARQFVGLRIKFMNAQAGKPGKVKPIRGQEERDLLSGNSSFNCFAEKNKVIADCTPLMLGEDGIEHLEPGDPENEDIVVDYYEVIYDGDVFRGDDIRNCPIEVSNHEANHGCTPRLVFGPEISGDHEVKFAASINGHRDVAGFGGQDDVTLKLNG